jgi:hypothetical protein
LRYVLVAANWRMLRAKRRILEGRELENGAKVI